MNWIVPANPNKCNHKKIFADHSTASWLQANNRFEVGDIIYLYCSAPNSAIEYQCVVTAIDLSFEEIRDDRKYWEDPEEFLKSKERSFIGLKLLKKSYSSSLGLDKLKAHGLKNAPQGRMQIKDPQLLEYIETEFAKTGKPA